MTFCVEHKIIFGKDEIRIEKLIDQVFTAYCNIETGLDDQLVMGNTNYESEIKKLVSSYKPRLLKESPIQMKLLLKDETPIWQPPRRLSPGEKEAVDKQISQWLDNKIIRPSSSEYASPIVLVRKKDNTKRLCIDYRKLNRQIVDIITVNNSGK